MLYIEDEKRRRIRKKAGRGGEKREINVHKINEIFLTQSWISGIQKRQQWFDGKLSSLCFWSKKKKKWGFLGLHWDLRFTIFSLKSCRKEMIQKRF